MVSGFSAVRVSFGTHGRAPTCKLTQLIFIRKRGLQSQFKRPAQKSSQPEGSWITRWRLARSKHAGTITRRQMGAVRTTVGSRGPRARKLLTVIKAMPLV
jgi:hypothetical protein